MRVAVLGSWRERDRAGWELRGDLKSFQAAARRVGEELARAGHGLIVGSDSDHTADRHAVDGALAALDRTSATPKILVVRPRTNRERLSFDEPRRSWPGLFVEDEVDASSRAPVKVFQVKAADAVVLLGGAEKTQQAGLTAAVSGKPLGCIGSFGGAARKLNELLLRSPATWGYDAEAETTLRKAQEPFSDVVLRSALSLAWIEGAPKLLLIHGRSPDRDLLKTHLTKDLQVNRVIVLADEFAATEPIPLKFERYARSVDGAIALVTPDDVGGLAAASELGPRARENVWVEVGWFWGRRGRSHLLLLRKGAAGMPSDLGNVENYEYVHSPLERADKIRRFVERLRSPQGP